VITMKITIFWVVTPYIWESFQCFGGTLELHFQGKKVSQSRDQKQVVREVASKTCLNVDSIFCALFMVHFAHRTGWIRVNALISYSGGARFEPLQGHHLF
jgi:hypothetical protein